MSVRENQFPLVTVSRVALMLCAGMTGLGTSTTSALAQGNAGAVPALAADSAGEIEEIVVTAQKTGSTTLQKTPLAITAFSDAQLKGSLTTNIKDLAPSAPSVSVGQLAQAAEIYIRGVGTNNVQNGSDPDVTMQIDGVYIARPSEMFGDFLDVDRIEILRGPQGTLYGRNAVGGTINIISKTPSNTFTGEEALTYGNYNTVQEQAYVSGPLIPGKLLGSLAIDYLYHDAYLKNITPGGNDVYNANHGGVHGQLRYEATDHITATTRFDWAALDEDIESYSNPLAPFINSAGMIVPSQAPGVDSLVGNFSKVALNTPQTETSHTYGVSEDIDAALDDHLTLKSITAFRENHYRVIVDTDDTDINYEITPMNEDEQELTQELNLQANYGRVDAVSGLYYYHEKDSSLGGAEVTPSAIVPGSPPKSALIQVTPVTWTDAAAAFAQATYHVTPTVGLTVGARYTWEKKRLDQDYEKEFTGPPVVDIPPYPFLGTSTRDFHAVTPKFGIDWNVTPDAMVYLSATRGYKSGGFNYAAATVATESFNPETIWSYEIGARTDWFDHKLRANLTAFKYDYNNLQAQSAIGPGLVTISNAAGASIKGIELEMTAKPTRDWRLTANLTLLDATYISYTNAPVAGALLPYVVHLPQYDAAAGTFNASGNRLDDAPRYTAFLAAERDWDLSGGTVYARTEYYWQDRVYFDPTNLDVQSQAPYGLVNAFAGYNTNGNWQVQLYGKNLANKGYYITTAANGLVPGGFVGAPRTFGIRVSYSF